MGGLLKKLGYFFVAFVALFTVAAIAIFLFFDPNDYRDRIAEEVKRETGRDLVIEGDLELSFFPWFAVNIGKTSLSNAPGFGDESFLSFEQAQLSVKLLPLLLDREISVGTATLDGFELNLEVASNGRNNWQDLEEAGRAQPDADETAQELHPARWTLLAWKFATRRCSNLQRRPGRGETYSLTRTST